VPEYFSFSFSPRFCSVSFASVFAVVNQHRMRFPVPNITEDIPDEETGDSYAWDSITNLAKKPRGRESLGNSGKLNQNQPKSETGLIITW
jgi:hypothetical protein